MNKPKFGASRKTSPMLNASETVKLIRLCGASYHRGNLSGSNPPPTRNGFSRCTGPFRISFGWAVTF